MVFLKKAYLPIADRGVPSNDPRNNCSILFSSLKWRMKCKDVFTCFNHHSWRHFLLFNLQVSSIAYKDQIADLIGCKPNLGRLFFRDPLLAIKCFFGPCCAAQYRLMGPGAWPGAKQVIEETYRNEMFPNVQRRNETNTTKNQTIVTLLKLVCVFATVATLKELCQDLNAEWDAVWGWPRAARWTLIPGCSLRKTADTSSPCHGLVIEKPSCNEDFRWTECRKLWICWRISGSRTETLGKKKKRKLFEGDFKRIFKYWRFCSFNENTISKKEKHLVHRKPLLK